MSKLEVKVVDQKTGQSLEGVFLSLSAGKTRITGTTGESGEYKFGKLSAQKFYLTAFLKEYQFKFDHENIGKDGSVIIQDGEHLALELQGKRIAFSAYGHVEKLGGHSVSFGVVTATSVGKTESANVNSDGSFRVMGLLPNTDYRLTFDQNEQIIRTIPEALNVFIDDDEEVTDLIFYGVYERKLVTIEGSVFFEGEEVKGAETVSATEKLFDGDGEQKVILELIENLNGHVLAVQQLRFSRYFAFRDLKPTREYSIRVKASKGEHDVRHQIDTEFPITSRATFQQLVIPRREVNHSEASVIRQVSGLVIPLAIAAGVFSFSMKQ